MRIDQRNSGGAVTATGAFVVDRWFFNNATDGTLSVQQSTDVPSGQGFSYSLKMTATVGDASIGSAQYCNFQHRIEGYNFSDFGFGASGASSVTLSFWVKATVTGNYAVALYNGAETRINPQAFTVNASNTWERKTITYAGDTTGTWLTTNGIGANVTFYPALGSNFLGSAGWNSGGTYGVTGQANAVASNGNIFAITGVQLEAGSIATPFERRQYGQEFLLCQRYCQTRLGSQSSTGLYMQMGWGNARSTSSASFEDRLTCTMRISPSLTIVGAASGFYIYSTSVVTCSTIAYDISDPNTMLFTVTTPATLTNLAFYTLGTQTATAQVIYSAEL